MPTQHLKSERQQANGWPTLRTNAHCCYILFETGARCSLHTPPHVASLLTSTPETSPNTGDILYELAENIPLYLPSPPQIRNLPGLEEIRDQEHRLQEAQADDALVHIHRQCRVTSPIYRTRSIIVLDLVKKTHRCNAQRAGKRWFLILEFLLF